MALPDKTAKIKKNKVSQQNIAQSITLPLVVSLPFIVYPHLFFLLHYLVLMLTCPFYVLLPLYNRSAWVLWLVCGYAAWYTASCDVLCVLITSLSHFLFFCSTVFLFFYMGVDQMGYSLLPTWISEQWASMTLNYKKAIIILTLISVDNFLQLFFS